LGVQGDAGGDYYFPGIFLINRRESTERTALEIGFVLIIIKSTACPFAHSLTAK
jgi:hypothetical protein